MNDRRTRIDDAIDRAVRDLVRLDPPAGFRRRVLSRLEAPARRAVLWRGFATAAAALAVVTLIVMMRDRPNGPAPAPQQAAVSEPTAPPSGVPTPPTPAPVPEPAAPRRLRRAPEPVRTATFGARDGRVSAANLREAELPRSAGPDAAVSEAIVIPAPPPIAIGSIEPPPPLAVPPIVVVPIQIPRVQLPPVSPPR